ncbi:hypothetical protein HYH03_010617 [Edaphochlamys debaryana]|uniref:Uncharacterized protein n=1 Tax=Edaphochlamys debaryana TaxID=47281 RepID=A0A835Y1Q8_9CHLO|nr:hypothetical protein HYH03_010617 [Edaphochlamys debaryana]|eukprot:KAG2490940.1 hypothetical protein HYH03_010617 [Edaphochlamys debaryana]
MLLLDRFVSQGAFSVPADSTLELRSMSLLLAQPPEFNAGTMLDHVFNVAAGARVVLTDVTVYVAKGHMNDFITNFCDPEIWEYTTEIKVLDGDVIYTTGSMPLRAESGVRASLTNVNFTIPGGAPKLCAAMPIPAGPGGDASLLRNAAQELQRSTKTTILLSLMDSVQLDNSTWQQLSLRVGVELGIYGRPTGLPTAIDFGGVESAFLVNPTTELGGRLVFKNLTLLGLPYASSVVAASDLMATFLHVGQINIDPNTDIEPALMALHSTLVLPDAEVAWWRTVGSSSNPGSTPRSVPDLWPIVLDAAREDGSVTYFLIGNNAGTPEIKLTHVTLLPFSRFSGSRSQAAAQAAASWPLAAGLGLTEATAGTIELGRYELMQASPLESLQDCRTGEIDTLWAPSDGGAARSLGVPAAALTGRDSILAAEDPSLGSRFFAMNGGASCKVAGLPLAVGRRRTFYDMRGSNVSLFIPPGSNLTLENMVLYNLPPSGSNLVPDARRLLRAGADTEEGAAEAAWEEQGGSGRLGEAAATEAAGAGSLRRLLQGPQEPITPPASPPPLLPDYPRYPPRPPRSPRPPPSPLPPVAPPTRPIAPPSPPSPPSPPPSPPFPSPPPSPPPFPSLPPSPPPPSPPPAPPPPPPPPVLVSTLTVLGMPLWNFDFNRTGANQLFLKNVTLVISQDELSLTLRMLERVGGLPSALTGGRRLNRRSLLQDPSSTADPPSPPPSPPTPPFPDPRYIPSEILWSCPFAQLITFARGSVVRSYTQNTIVFDTVQNLGWAGTDVVVTSVLPADAPTKQLEPSATLKMGLSTLEAACPPPAPVESDAPPPRRFRPPLSELQTDTGSGGSPSSSSSDSKNDYLPWMIPVVVCVPLLLIAVFGAAFIYNKRKREEEAARHAEREALKEAGILGLGMKSYDANRQSRPRVVQSMSAAVQGGGRHPQATRHMSTTSHYAAGSPMLYSPRRGPADRYASSPTVGVHVSAPLHDGRPPPLEIPHGLDPHQLATGGSMLLAAHVTPRTAPEQPKRAQHSWTAAFASVTGRMSRTSAPRSPAYGVASPTGPGPRPSMPAYHGDTEGDDPASPPYARGRASPGRTSPAKLMASIFRRGESTGGAAGGGGGNAMSAAAAAAVAAAAAAPLAGGGRAGGRGGGGGSAPTSPPYAAHETVHEEEEGLVAHEHVEVGLREAPLSPDGAPGYGEAPYAALGAGGDVDGAPLASGAGLTAAGLGEASSSPSAAHGAGRPGLGGSGHGR